MQPVPEGVRALAPIGLADLDAHASLQDRVDVKYVVEIAQLDALLQRLAATHRALEMDGRRAFGYRTTYYDTDDMLTYREHVQDRRRRFKCRKRRYVDSDRAVFEVKLKGSRGRTVKHAMACCDGDELTADEAAFLDAHLLHAYGRRLERTLAPTLVAACRRCTIVAPELGERLTCDIGLDFGGAGLRGDLAIVESKSARGRAAADAALRGDLAIVESKSARGRAAADAALRDMGVRPVARCSKYLVGMALTRGDLRDNHLRPLLRRYFSDAC